MIRVLHYVAKMDRAGQETFIMNLFRKVDKSRFQFMFLCTNHEKGAYDDEIYDLGGKIFYVIPQTMPGPLKQIQGFFNLQKALRATPCDVFHIHTHHAMNAFMDALAAKLCGVKTVVVHSHNTSALYHLRAHSFFKRLLPLLPIKRFACSKAAGEWMFMNDNFRVIHNGLNLDELYFRAELRDKIRDEMGWNNKKIIGHVGRFNEQKNHRFLIEIFEKVHLLDSSTRLVLIGSGELEPEIRSLVNRKNLEDAVSFLGVREDVKQLYQGMDLFLFPSLFEGLPVSLMEAEASCLLSLVSSAVTEEAAVTDTVHRLSLELGAEAWAEEAVRLLAKGDQRDDNRLVMRRAGYDITTLAENLEDMYFS